MTCCLLIGWLRVPGILINNARRFGIITVAFAAGYEAGNETAESIKCVVHAQPALPDLSGARQ